MTTNPDHEKASDALAIIEACIESLHPAQQEIVNSTAAYLRDYLEKAPVKGLTYLAFCWVAAEKAAENVE